VTFRLSEEDALNLLREARCPPDVIKHCERVSELATRIALACKREGMKVDIDLVKVGSLLHDIGRAKTHGIDHGIIGASIARSRGLPQPILSIIENHLLAGIKAEEAAKFNLPARDYMPKSLEERIVTYADKVVEGARLVRFEEVLKRFSKWLGEDHPVIRRLRRLHEEFRDKYKEIQKMM
jgi:uncharacterized protein